MKKIFLCSKKNILKVFNLSLFALLVTQQSQAINTSEIENGNFLLIMGTGLNFANPYNNGKIDFQNSKMLFAEPNINVGLGIQFFNEKKNLGFEVKGQWQLTESLRSYHFGTSMFYGIGTDFIYQPAKMFGIYVGGGYEQFAYMPSDTYSYRFKHAPFANVGMRIGFRGMFVDVGYKYTFMNLDNARLDLPANPINAPFNVSSVYANVNIPFIPFALAIAEVWSTSSEYERIRREKECGRRYPDWTISYDRCMRGYD